MGRERVTLEQEYTELLQQVTPDTTAHSMVHAEIKPDSIWLIIFAGLIADMFASGKTETGFAMIDKGDIYFYPVTGLRKNRELTGRVKIGIDRVERLIGRKRGSLPHFKLRWRNSNNKRRTVTLGGSSHSRQFPNQQKGIDEMSEMLIARGFELKPDLTWLKWVVALPVMFALGVIIALFLY